MVIEIKKKYSEKKKKELLNKLRKEVAQKRSLREFFGILKTGEDGLEFQKRVRNEWD
jgi:hypothetical protein